MTKDEAAGIACQAAAVRARDFGAELAAEDVTVRLLERPVAGFWVFVASWGHPRLGEGIAGVVDSDGTPNTYPNVALARLWAQSERAVLPESPCDLAMAAAALLAGPAAHFVLVDDRDFAAATDDRKARRQLRAPFRRDDDARPALVFWWDRRGEVSQMTLTLEAGADRVHMSEQFLRELEA